MINFSFNSTKILRKNILERNSDIDSVFIEGNNYVLISIPHGVDQIRLGKYKVAEIGTIPLGVLLAKYTQSHILIKTKNSYDDANFDLDCDYRKKLKKLIKQYNIKYLIDIHGLAKWRDCDVNLGINIGQNIKQNEEQFNKLNTMLNSVFHVEIDNPFMGSGNTISCRINKEFDIWTIQIEINCGITNYSKNIEKFNKLLNILVQWIKNLT